MFFKRNVGRGLSFFTKSLFVLGLFCFLLSGYAAAQHTISGRITEGGSGLTGVTLTGLPNSPILTDGTGFYTDTVPSGWSGTVTPGLAGYTFTPESIDYTNVTEDFLDQDYTASVSVQFSASSSIGDEGDTPAILEISLSAVSNLDVSVNYAVSGGNATGGGVDYTLSSGTATILSGATTSNDISIAVLDDLIDEFDETIFVDLSVPVNADLGPTDQHTYTINDNDALPSVGFSLTGSSENEAVGTANLLVVLSELSGRDVQVDYSVFGGTATGGGVDYTLTPNTLTIPAGSLSANIPVTINDDVLPEAAETVILELSGPLYATLGTAQHTLTIIDNEALPTVQFSLSADNGDESTTPVDIVLTLIPTSGADVDVSFTTGGTATGADYSVATASPITIPAGNSTANITLNIVDDPTIEGDETVVLNLTGATNAVVGTTDQHTYTINDNDVLPTVAFVGAPYTHAESGSQTVTVTMTGTSISTVTVDYATSDGTATAGLDYTAASGQLSWAPGTSGDRTFTIPIAAETTFELDETVNIDLSTPVGCTITGGSNTTLTITNDDTQPVVDFSSVASNGSEATSPVNLQLTMTNASYLDVTVSFSTGGTATGADYSVATPSPIAIPAGSTTANITLNVVDDASVEGDETVIVDLTGATNATLGTTEPHTYTINDNDVAPTIAYAGAPYTHAESGSQTVTVTMTGTSISTVTVDYATSDGTATAGLDYTAASGQLSWAPGTSGDRTFTIPIAAETTFELNETVNIDLSTPVGCTITGGSNTTLTITNDDTQPVVDFSSVASNGSEATTPVNLQLTMTNASYLDVSVSFSTGGTATGADYSVATPSPIAIPAGSTAANITLNVVDDAISEGDETVIIDLTGATNASLGPTEPHTYTINDNDAAPTVAYSGAPYTHAESGSQTVTVSMTGTSGSTVTVDYATSDGTATAGVDYTAASGQLSWAPGETGNKTFNIPITADAIFEGDETVNIGLTNPVGCTITGGAATTLTITDDDAAPDVQFSLGASNGGEGVSPVNLQVSLSSESGRAVTVDYSVTGGSATEGVDYTIAASPVTIPAGNTSANIVLNIVNDSIDEVNETVEVTLTDATNGTLVGNTVHTYTINDNDAEPEVQFVLGASNSSEATTVVNLAVSLSAISAKTVTVDYSVTGGTATEGVDYTIAASPVTIPAGNTSANIVLNIVNDSLDEPDETIRVDLTGATNAGVGTRDRHTFTIIDNDAEPTVDFSALSSSGGEESSPVNLELTLSIVSGLDVIVEYSVTGGTATQDTDFTIAPSPVTISAGQTSTNIVLNIVNDTLDEPNETIIVTFGNITNAVKGANDSHTYTITDNDDPPEVYFFSAPYTHGETGIQTVTVRISGESGRTVRIDYATSDGTANAGEDYTGISGQLTWNPGQTGSRTFDVVITEDVLDEDDETVNLTLSNASNCTIRSPNPTTLTITDDDAEPAVSFSGAPYTHDENGSQTVTVSLSAESEKTITVEYETADGTATAGEDYTDVSGQLTWDPGQTENKTFSITILEDLLAEDDETVNITLSNASNCTIAPPNPTTLTITDDDDLDFETDLDEVLIPEGGTAIFSVRLTAEPLSNVDVLVSRLSGDSDITVQSGSNLLFTPVNWDQYQEVTLAAAEDPDIDDGQATIRINAIGIPALDITATEQDNAILNGEIALVLSSAEGTSGIHFDTNIAIFNNKQQVSSFDLDFHFDDSMFTFVGSESGTLTSNWSVLTANEVSAGNIEVHGISGGGTPIPASSQGSVIKIMLQIKCLNLPNDTNTQLQADNYQNGIIEYAPDPCIEVFTFKPCTMLGDVDANGNVTPGDAQMAFEIFLGRITPDMCQEMTSDADCSSVTTPGDSQQIFEHFLGRRVLPTCCAEAASLFTAMPKYLERPDLEEEEERSRREDSPSNHLLYPLKIVGLSEEIISVPVILTNPAGIRSFGFELSYPSGLLEYLGTKQSTLTDGFDYLEGTELAEGLIRVEGEGEMPIQSNDTGSLAILLFKVNKGADISLPVTILNAYGDILHAELIDGSITRLDNEWELSRFLNLGNARQKSDGTVRVPLRVNTGFLLKAFGLVMRYSTENLTFIGIERGKLTEDFVSLDAAEVKSGRLKVGGFAMSEILELEPGTLFYLVFSKHGTSGEVEILRLMDDLHHYVIQNGQTVIQ